VSPISVIREALEKRRANARRRAAADEGVLVCERCGQRRPLAELPPLDLAACPTCGWKNFVPQLVADFLLHEPIGAGGFNRVYRAVRRGDWRTPYAVKVLRADAARDPERLDQFRFEGEAHRRIGRHPNIVPLLEAGDFFHAMPLVEGRNLRQWVEQEGRRPEAQVRAWAAQIVPALRHIVEHGFLYRDVSPGNFIVTAGDQVLLVDFGLVLPLDEADRAERERHVEGTAEYVPPERVLRLGEDERSVIYSLGHLLFFLLSGEPMMSAATREQAALRHVSELRVTFSGQRLPGCSASLVKWIGRMTDPDPAARPDSLATLEFPTP
jgi:eukaryotic-like serine/threonine-protein kinase